MCVCACVCVCVKKRKEKNVLKIEKKMNIDPNFSDFNKNIIRNNYEKNLNKMASALVQVCVLPDAVCPRSTVIKLGLVWHKVKWDEQEGKLCLSNLPTEEDLFVTLSLLMEQVRWLSTSCDSRGHLWLANGLEYPDCIP